MTNDMIERAGEMGLVVIHLGPSPTTGVGDLIPRIRTWFEERSLRIREDYLYLGIDEQNRDVFAIRDREAAMMFKLTFGGL